MSNPTVVISGAAAGIGRATALAFARAGYDVGAYDLDEAGLASLADEVRTLGVAAHTGHLDVTDAGAFETVLNGFVETTGRLDVLVNNAGVLLAGEFTDIAVDRHHAEIDVNVKGVVNGLHAGHPHLLTTARQHGGSTVVNLCSASAIYGQAELANYSATKFFVRGLTEALDLEWSPQGVRVIAMWPLFVRTGMLEGISTATTKSLGVRLGPEDVAAAIIAAVSPSRPRRAIHQVHFPVGLQTSALALGSRFSPAWLTRLTNKRFAAH